MLDPGRYFAEAIYFLQYTLAQLLWAVNRATLSIAVITESVNSWLTDNISYFVQLLVNALSAPLGGLFIMALTALGFWYTLNNIVPTSRWVDPGKLFTYGLVAFIFFSSPIVVIDRMETLRQSLNAGIDQALIDGAAGDIFATGMNGTDSGLPAAIPDVNSDGIIGSFDLVSAFMQVANLDELDSSEFPVDFEAAFFPFGDPSGINLGDEADQELAKALASDGIERLFFALVAIPTAIAEHFLHLALTGVALFLYTGVPFAMLFAFFIYTQAFLGAYLRQFINLLIETLMSVIIVAVMLTLLAAAARQGTGLYIGASVLTLIVLVWRIQSALRLAAAALDLFGGSMLTGGAGGLALARTGSQAVTGTAVLGAAALTGGAALAAGGAAMTAAAALRADGRHHGAFLGTDPAKSDGRARQLKTIAGYALGRSGTVRTVIENAHETRTLARNFRDGDGQPHEPDMLDYLRAGSSMSGFGSSPWLAMRLSPSLRAAYDEIGGRRSRNGTREAAYDTEGEPVDLPARPRTPASSPDDSSGLADRFASLEQALANLTEAMTGSRADQQEIAYAPIPEWLREDGGQTVQDGRLAHTGPDADGSGLVAAHETEPVPAAASHPADNPPGTVRLEAYGPRAQAVGDTLARLADPRSPAGQAAQRTLVTYTGQNNARLIQGAVGQHTAAAVQEAATAAANLVTQYRAQGMDDAAVLAAFQSGEAAAAIREAAAAQDSPTPLTDEQLSAVADMVLLPRRRLTRPELANVIGRQAAAGAGSEQAVVQAIGSPVGFGGQTGTVRGVLAGARDMTLSPADLTRLAGMIQDGLREAVQAELTAQGHPPEKVRHFVSDMAALPAALVVPQSTAHIPPQTGDEHAA